MKVTLTLDDALAARIRQVAAGRGVDLETLVAEVLRKGLDDLEKQSAATEPYRTPGVNRGRCLVPALEDVQAVLAGAEGEDYLEVRAARGSREKFEAVLAKVPDVEPEEYDRLPAPPSK